MTFARPELLHLVWPLLAVIVLRCLALGREVRTVSTLVLWQRVEAAGGARTRRRGRVPPEVWLELALGLLLVALAAGPRPAPVAEEPPHVVVRDAGLAMLAPARRREADGLVASLHPDRVVLVPSVPAEAATSETDWAAALGPEARPGVRLDLVVDAVADPDSIPAAVGVHVVAAPVANVGIVAAAATLVASGDAEVFVGVAASRWDAGRGEVVVRASAGAATAVASVLPREAAQVDVLLRLAVPADGRRIDVVLEGASDDLPGDDAVSLIRDSAALVIAVEVGLSSFADAIIADGGAVALTPSESVPRAAMLLVARTAPPGFEGAAIVVMGGGVRGPERLVPVHPWLDSLPWNEVRLPSFRAVDPSSVGADAQVLLRAGDHPVAVWSATRRRLVLGFDPEGEFAERPLFPLFVRAALIGMGFASTTRDARTFSAVPTGVPLRHRIVRDHAVWERPDGSRERIASAGDGTVEVVPWQRGVHRLIAGSDQHAFAAAPLSFEETTAVATPDAAKDASRPVRADRGERPLDRQVALAALALLGILSLLRFRASGRSRRTPR